jgi:hypothetical protein
VGAEFESTSTVSAVDVGLILHPSHHFHHPPPYIQHAGVLKTEPTLPLPSSEGCGLACLYSIVLPRSAPQLSQSTTKPTIRAPPLFRGMWAGSYFSTKGGWREEKQGSGGASRKHLALSSPLTTTLTPYAANPSLCANSSRARSETRSGKHGQAEHQHSDGPEQRRPTRIRRHRPLFDDNDTGLNDTGLTITTRVRRRGGNEVVLVEGNDDDAGDHSQSNATTGE